MKLDPTKLQDWQIAELAEQNMKPLSQLCEEMGIEEDEVIAIEKELELRDMDNSHFWKDKVRI